ncbi:MAG: glycosyltransferase [Anaerolineaceae bacterium]|nr:glycosyltransferase [Anaerolineaceae bacterium]
MHITILALGSRGDIQPFAVLGNGLKKAGHEVRFITFENFADLIAVNGLDFHRIQGDARSLVSTAGASMPALIRSFSSLARGYALDLSVPLLGETDLFINQLPGGLYAHDLAGKYNKPMISAAIMPLARNRDFPLIGFPKIPLPGYNRLTYMLGESVVW